MGMKEQEQFTEDDLRAAFNRGWDEATLRAARIMNGGAQ